MSLFNSPIFIILIIIFSILILIYIRSKFECRHYKIKDFHIKNSKNDSKLKLVFLSDFHNKHFKKYNKRLIEDIINIKPDYIILGGDFIDFTSLLAHTNQIKDNNTINFIIKLAEKVKEINKDKNYNIKRIFFSFGNHELRLKKYAKNDKLINAYNDFINVLKENDVYLLDNVSYKLCDGINISGLSLFDGYYNNVFRVKENFEHIDKDILTKYFGEINKKDYNIMLFHKPDYCEDLINYGYDLVLSGHNHGGLLVFPKIGSLLSSDLKLFPKYSYGQYDIDGKNVIVSSGIGEHFLRLRLNNYPEFCVINIE